MSEAAIQTAIAEAASIRSVRALMWRRFSKNRLAVVSGVILVVLYAIALFAPFFSAYHHDAFHVTFKFAPPQKVHFRDEEGRLSRPFVYARERSIDMTTLAISYREVKTTKYPIRFFVASEPYKLVGFIPMSVRLYGVDSGATLFLWGTDTLGRDILSRVWTGAQVSLSVPLVGTLITIVLGSILGVASAYFGRMVDNAIQRIIELLISFPQIPLWIALSAAIPVTWPSGFVYLGVVVILSLIGWGSLARVVRGKVLAYRQEEYVMAAPRCRLQPLADHQQAPPARLPQPHHRRRHAGHTGHDPRREQPELPGHRHHAAADELGGDAEGRPERAGAGPPPVAGHSRAHDHPGRALLQLLRRRITRCRRSVRDLTP